MEDGENANETRNVRFQLWHIVATRRTRSKCDSPLTWLHMGPVNACRGTTSTLSREQPWLRHLAVVLNAFFSSSHNGMRRGIARTFARRCQNVSGTGNRERSNISLGLTQRDQSFRPGARGLA